MSNTELVKKLREISRSASPYKKQLLRQAARRIEEQEKLIAKLVADLKEVDVDCRKCIHKKTPAPCVDSDEEVCCNNCPYGCECKDCYDNSKYEYDAVSSPGTCAESRSSMVQYEDYVLVEPYLRSPAQGILLARLFETIKRLSKKEDFWIVKESVSGMSFQETNRISVGLKVAFPQMKEALNRESGTD